MTIKIQLTEEYKSFPKGYKYELNGDLIILSGLNGSGKSHLLEYIKGLNGDVNINPGSIFLDDYQISPEMVIIQNINDVLEIRSTANHHWLDISKDRLLTQLFIDLKGNDNSLTRSKLTGFNKDKIISLRGEFLNIHKYSSTFIEITNAIEEFLKLSEDEKEITEIEFKDIFKNSMLLLEDDSFLIQIDKIFTNYLTSQRTFFCTISNERHEITRQHAEGKIDSTSHTDKITALNKKYSTFEEEAPWKILNPLLAKLKIDYYFEEPHLNTSEDRLSKKPTLVSTTLDKKKYENFNFLSSGEKAILQLVCAKLTPKSKIKLLLLDEYDAILNPSLIEIFYNVLDEFFIQKGIVVVIATHSISTIAMALPYATFYEVNKTFIEPRIREIKKHEYKEFEKHLKAIKFAKNLETELSKYKKPILLVEDELIDIYQIGWLRLKEIGFENNKHGEVFNNQSNFVIHPAKGANILDSLLRSSSFEFIKSEKILALFDFDEKGAEIFFERLRSNLDIWDNNTHASITKDTSKENILFGNETEGFYYKRKNYEIYAIILPIPERLKIYASKEFGKRSCVEIENLLSDRFLDSCIKKEGENRKWEKNGVGGGKFLEFNSNHKEKIRKALSNSTQEDFLDFKKIFNAVDQLLFHKNYQSK